MRPRYVGSRTAWLSAVTLALVLTGTACGSSDGNDHSATNTASPAHRDAQSSAAKDALRDAITAMLKADSGHWAQSIDVAERTGVFTVSGEYHFRAETAAMDMTQLADSGKAQTLHSRLIHGEFYLNVPTGGPADQRTCWLHLKKAALGESATAQGTDDGNRFPAPLEIVPDARGLAFVDNDDTQIRADIDLSLAMYVIAPGLAAGLADKLAGGRTTGTFTVNGNRLDSLVINGSDVQEAGEAKHVSMPDGLDLVTTRVDYSRPGQGDPVTAPPAGLQRTSKELDAGRGCPR